ncbi:MAG: 4Fe-4S ferredoxin [Candidatus Bathyarchaeota archaeon]|nr:4Fe-4S ferredoxin [Candidatus Bathyarchaeota archaeon]
MVTRKIIEIDEKLCNGCGECIPNCAEGAMQIVNGKAKIVKDSYCDGLGACLGHCPQGALSIIEREAEDFDEESAKSHIKKIRDKKYKTKIKKPQWPIQLNLVSPNADFFDNSDILLVADCVPATYPDFHTELVSEKKVLIGCPKFDDATKYAAKLGEILKLHNIKSITVAHMEVPCCSGLKWIAQKAVENSNKNIPIKNIMIGVNGEIK